jgi:hypothetical protein
MLTFSSGAVAPDGSSVVAGDSLGGMHFLQMITQ